jgi:transposase-like protein
MTGAVGTLATAEWEELTRLRREYRDLRRSNEIPNAVTMESAGHRNI